MNYCYEYPRPAVAVDVVIVCLNPTPQILLILRRHKPFADHWALPGGFLNMDETLEEAATREVREETGIDIGNRGRQVQAFSTVDRDPRGRVISVAFLAEFVDKPTGRAADDAKDLKWFELGSLPPLAFDHPEIIAAALANLALDT
jgi:8-oxo-dGTP diphosphatase